MGRLTRRIYKSTVGVVNVYGRRKMAGEVFSHAGTNPPAGALLCNGALISRTAYANLFAAIGIVYGAGDGNTTFAIPDLRGEFPRFADQGRGVDVARAVGSGQAGQNAAHFHNQTAWSDGPAGVMLDAPALSNAAPKYSAMTGGGGSNAVLQSQVTQSGGNEARPRNVALLPCIYY